MKSFRFISFNRDLLWTLEITGIYTGRKRFVLLIPPVVLCVQILAILQLFKPPCKIFAFWFKSLAFSILPNVLPLFLYLIIKRQQRLVMGKVFGWQRFLAFSFGIK